MAVSGILRAQNQPLPDLRGQGILIGFIDTGIDYTHQAFRDPDGNTRILSIWDQTIQSENPPEGLLYGTEYTGEAAPAGLLLSPGGHCGLSGNGYHDECSFPFKFTEKAAAADGAVPGNGDEYRWS